MRAICPKKYCRWSTKISGGPPKMTMVTKNSIRTKPLQMKLKSSKKVANGKEILMSYLKKKL